MCRVYCSRAPAQRSVGVPLFRAPAHLSTPDPHQWQCAGAEALRAVHCHFEGLRSKMVWPRWKCTWQHDREGGGLDVSTATAKCAFMGCHSGAHCGMIRKCGKMPMTAIVIRAYSWKWSGHYCCAHTPVHFHRGSSLGPSSRALRVQEGFPWQVRCLACVHVLCPQYGLHLWGGGVAVLRRILNRGRGGRAPSPPSSTVGVRLCLRRCTVHVGAQSLWAVGAGVRGR